MDFIKAFEEMDVDNCGEISREDLVRYMQLKKYKPIFVEKWLKIFDADNTGIITLKEFCNTLGLVPALSYQQRLEKRKNENDIAKKLQCKSRYYDLYVIDEDSTNCEEFREYCLKLCEDATHNQNELVSIAKYIKSKLDMKYERSWNVVVDKDAYGSFLSHDPGAFIHIKDNRMNQCIYKYGFKAVSYELFDEISCNQCFRYLGFTSKSGSKESNFIGKNYSELQFIDRCKTFYYPDDCSRLWNCCADAKVCCERQMENYKKTSGMESFCPMVWDGFSCWNETEFGYIASQKCPEFLLFKSNKVALKACLENGTWQTTSNGTGWTDYSQCTDIQKSLIPLWIEMCFLILSISITIPAMLFLVSIERLRSVVRIRLHLLLLFSLTCRSFIRTVWNFQLILPALESRSNYNLSYSNVCLVVRITLLYLDSLCFFCFVLEGIYLFRLISNSLRRPKHVLSMSICCLTLPLISVIIYSISRYHLNEQNQDKCWIGTSSKLEWINIAPNLLCVAINIVLLLYVLRILMNRFGTRGRDVINIRRTVKAIIVLVPLFGIQIICTIYRIDNNLFSIFSSAINDTQAIWASINLSFFNKEVRMKVKLKKQRIQNSLYNRWSDRHSSKRTHSQRSKNSVFRKLNTTIRNHRQERSKSI